jgi:hypothetical protein
MKSFINILVVVLLIILLQQSLYAKRLARIGTYKNSTTTFMDQNKNGKLDPSESGTTECVDWFWGVLEGSRTGEQVQVGKIDGGGYFMYDDHDNRIIVAGP